MNILVTGCSMTYGHGLEFNKDDPRLWVNSTLHSVFGDDITIDNIAKDGMNNHWILLETMNGIRTKQYDMVVVGWSSIPRYCFHVDVELYEVHTALRPGAMDINSNRFEKTSASWLRKTGDRLRKIHNDYWDILDLIKYVNVLMESTHGDKVFFVNTMIDYPREYFKYKKFEFPDEISEYEQELLNVPGRSDDAVKELYDMMHDEYNNYGGIHEDRWINLYDSLKSKQVDDISDSDNHPSYMSQKLYTKMFTPIFDKKFKQFIPG